MTIITTNANGTRTLTQTNTGSGTTTPVDCEEPVTQPQKLDPKTFYSNLFDQADKDKDGMLNHAEFGELRFAIGGAGVIKMLFRENIVRDLKQGFLSKDTMFEKIEQNDKNKDGFIDKRDGIAIPWKDGYVHKADTEKRLNSDGTVTFIEEKDGTDPGDRGVKHRYEKTYDQQGRLVKDYCFVDDTNFQSVYTTGARGKAETAFKEIKYNSDGSRTEITKSIENGEEKELRKITFNKDGVCTSYTNNVDLSKPQDNTVRLATNYLISGLRDTKTNLLERKYYEEEIKTGKKQKISFEG